MLPARHLSKALMVRAASQQQRILPPFRVTAMDGVPTIQRSSLSTTTESKGPWGWLTSKFADREKAKQEKQYQDQIKRMSESEQWTLKDFLHDLDLTLSGWKMHVPGFKETKEIKAAKSAQNAVKAFGDEIGLDGTCVELRNLGRTEKLRISYKSGLSIEEVNGMMQQFEIMDMMHKVLRYRAKNGKPLPMDPTAMSAAMQVDAKNAYDKNTRQAIVAKRNPFGRRGKQSSCKKF